MEIIKWRPINETEEIPPFGEELERRLERRNGAVKHASYSAWNLLYQILLENGLPVSTLSITDTGKPYFTNSNIYFSLSHSHNICAVAVADKPVGADVEIIKTSYPPHLIERSLTTDYFTRSVPPVHSWIPPVHTSVPLAKKHPIHSMIPRIHAMIPPSATMRLN